MIIINTDKTLDNKFIERQTNHPIWYYKELEPVDVDYVIAYLLKETFVVEIEGSKHEITFGYNKEENYIGQCIKYDDIKNSKLCSFEVIQKGFKKGKWFIITDKDTSEEFKTDYEQRKAEYQKEETEKWYRQGLINVIKEHKDLNKEQKENCIQEIENASYEKLEELMKALFNNSEGVVK